MAYFGIIPQLVPQSLHIYLGYFEAIHTPSHRDLPMYGWATTAPRFSIRICKSPNSVVVVSSSTPGTETILLVEDEPQVRAMEAIILADQGYAVLQAADGEEALLVCQENQDQDIHLLVTDMVMPRMSGGELITELSSKRPETKFLVVSGYAEGAVERCAVTRGDVHFMQKPFKPLELANAVRAILDGVPEPSV